LGVPLEENSIPQLRSTSIMKKWALPLPDERWLPKSVLCLRDYTPNKFLHDLLAGTTVGLVALPLAMAFAIASGSNPQAGIYCAIVTGFLISALGGSKTQIGGRPALSSSLLPGSSLPTESTGCSCVRSWLEFCS
jgi:MFS superfamily sulfate permease-like transporter